MREHGAYAKYKLDGCRCYPCAARVSEYNSARSRAIAYGTWQPFVDAGPVRAHLEVLRECGIGLRQAAALAGVNRKTLQAVLNGKPGQPPTARVRPALAAAVLAIEPSLENVALSTPVDAAGTHRRVQALVFVGWSQAKIGKRLRMTPSNFVTFMKSAQVSARHALAVRALYDELWDQPPPEVEHRDKISASRARRHAVEAGWLPPAAWDDDLIDVPDEELDAAIARRVAAMDDEDLLVCHRGRGLGDPSLLIRAGDREYERRRRERAKTGKAAA